MSDTINKIILFGSTGMLGRYVYSFFSASKYRVICINARITNESLPRVEEWLETEGIDEKTCVINCVGQIPQRTSNGFDNKTYFLINSLFPHILWGVCKKHSAKMIQPTTDCVFSGKKIGGKYTDNDAHDESSLYGMSKSLGEPLESTVIRTSIIGREKNNKKSFLEWVLNSKGEISGWSNHYWNGITCLEYCRVLLKIIEGNLFWKGVRHIYSPTPASKYEMACFIKEAFGMNIIIHNTISTETVYKTLTSIETDLFNIQPLEKQIKELVSFELL